MVVKIKPIRYEELSYLWQIGFSDKGIPEWKQWDGPYFDDYRPTTETEFIGTYETLVRQEKLIGIYVDERLIGQVTRYWENEKTRWLEIGIIIYESEYWNGGYGTEALTQWITQTFQDIPLIERVGLTTWSGNNRMMRVAEKLGMKQEACIRKVRYWQGVYYDSVKYGVLREEWKSIAK